MQWLVTNWFWVLFGIAFVGMHMFGHGGHGGHAGDHQRMADGDGLDESPRWSADGAAGGHQHSVGVTLPARGASPEDSGDPESQKRQ
jgi:hypothetical protein